MIISPNYINRHKQAKMNYVAMLHKDNLPKKAAKGSETKPGVETEMNISFDKSYFLYACPPIQHHRIEKRNKQKHY